MGRAPRIAGFELIQPLGGGPFSRVYSAHEFASDSVVALKHLPVTLHCFQPSNRVGLKIQNPTDVGFGDLGGKPYHAAF